MPVIVLRPVPLPSNGRPWFFNFSCSESKSLVDLARVGEVEMDGDRDEGIVGMVDAGCSRGVTWTWECVTVRVDVIGDDAVGVITLKVSVEDLVFCGFSQGGREARLSGEAGFR
jgi:hypothetical protein